MTRPQRAPPDVRQRRGTAIVAALGLLVLAAALLAFAAEIAASATRRTRADVSALLAESTARRALASAVEGWQAAYDSLADGQGIELREGNAECAGSLVPCRAQVRVRRLRGPLYAVSVDATAGVPPLRARRRVRLLVNAGSAAERGTAGAVRPISRWSLTDLY